jgi:hypothetical protein
MILEIRGRNTDERIYARQLKRGPNHGRWMVTSSNMTDVKRGQQVTWTNRLPEYGMKPVLLAVYPMPKAPGRERRP